MSYFERQRDLDALRRERKHIRDELEDLDVLMKEINAEEVNIAEGLDTTLANVRVKLDRLPSNSLFRDTHYSRIRDALRGSDSDKLFRETSDGIEKSEKKKCDLEYRLSVVNEKIATLEAESMDMEANENG